MLISKTRLTGTTLAILFLLGIAPADCNAAAQEGRPPATRPGSEGMQDKGGRSPDGDNDDEKSGQEPRKPLTEEELAAKSMKDATNAFKKMLEKFDANKDGKVSKEENPKATKQFDTHDSNKDGFLEEKEYVSGRVALDKERREARKKRKDEAGKENDNNGAKRIEMQFMRLDSNGDGKITSDEDKGLFIEGNSRDLNKDGFVTLEEYGFFIADSKEFYESAFSSLDKNSDGVLSKEEAATLLASNPKIDTNNDGTVARDEYFSIKQLEGQQMRKEMVKTHDDRFKAMDLNNDGKLEGSESANFMKTRPAADVNRDGSISVAEFKAALIAAPTRPTMGGADKHADMIIGQYDRNKDGKLDEVEAQVALKDHPEFDMNKDKMVDREELLAFLEKERSQPPANALTFERFDKNSDGKITKDEAPSLFSSNAKVDTDGDEVISKEEFNTKFGRLKPPGESGKKNSPPRKDGESK